MSTQPKDKLPHLKYLLYGAILLFIITLGAYFLNFHEGISTDHTEWGTFGDFMGGTLNPIFAIFSLAAILYTIKIQTEELELSRKELEATRDELRKSSEAQQEQSDSFKIQNESIKLQSFENTFFQLLNLWLQTREHLSIEIGDSDSTDSFNRSRIYKVNINKNSEIYDWDKIELSRGKEYSSKAISIYLNILNVIYELNYDKFNTQYENYTGTYFIQIYQLLKFVHNSSIVDKQFYANLLRAQLTKEELEFLFYHCLGSIGERKFKPLVEEFEFFEHLVFNNTLKKHLIRYSSQAYGNNQTILFLHKEVLEKVLGEK